MTKGIRSTREQAELSQGTRGDYDYRAGTSGTVVIPAGVRVQSWSARSTLATATVTINGGDSIPIRGGSAGGDPKGTLVAPTFVFTDTDAYYIELGTRL